MKTTQTRLYMAILGVVNIWLLLLGNRYLKIPESLVLSGISAVEIIVLSYIGGRTASYFSKKVQNQIDPEEEETKNGESK